MPRGLDHARVTQGSARAVWQFFDNQWIHPYLLAGLSVDAVRKKTVALEKFQFNGDPRLPGSRVRVVQPRTEGPDTTLRAGLVAGGGAKLYFSSNVFANTTLLVTRSMSSTSVSWVAGLGMDF